METIKDFQNMLLVKEMEVFTNHKNINYENIESTYQFVQLCMSLMQEFGATLIYIKREANVFANDFSRLPMAHHTHK